MRDLNFIVSLATPHAIALGFIPRRAVQEKLLRGQFLVARIDGQRVGFLYHGSMNSPRSGPHEVKIFQVAVCPEARGRGVASRLVRHVAALAWEAGAETLTLRCRASLEANGFWRCAGFRLIGREPGGASRGEAINIWRRRLPAPSLRQFKEELRA